jgi:hypothetical protein
MIKIAISGKINAGKNTLATLLVKHLGLTEDEAKIVGLADPMKNMILQMIPNAERECLFGPSDLRSCVISEDLIANNGNPMTYRQALLDLGKFGRCYNQNIWLNALVQDAKRSDTKKAYIVSDVRFVNEFKYLQNANFYTIRIKRTSNSLVNDISETDQNAIHDNQFDAIIQNYGDLEALDNHAQKLIDHIYKHAF